MESIYTKLALYGSKNECARTGTVFSHISEVCYGTVSLTKLFLEQPLALPGSAKYISISYRYAMPNI